MKNGVRPVPEGYQTVTPYLVVRGADKAIDFYKRAFGAVEVGRSSGPGGQGIMHADLKIGNSHVFLSDEFPNMGNPSPQTLGGTTCAVFLYVENVDAVFAQAVAAGAKAQMPPADMFWGDRYAKLTDPFGHAWSMATHIEDMTPEEMTRRSEKFFADMAKNAPKA